MCDTKMEWSKLLRCQNSQRHRRATKVCVSVPPHIFPPFQVEIAIGLKGGYMIFSSILLGCLCEQFSVRAKRRKSTSILV